MAVRHTKVGCIIITLAIIFCLIVAMMPAQRCKAQTDIFNYYRAYSGGTSVVDTLDLLKAADDWSAEASPPGFIDAITTMQLLALADEWSLSPLDGLHGNIIYCEDKETPDGDYMHFKVNMLDLDGMLNKELFDFSIQTYSSEYSDYIFNYFYPTLAVSPDESKIAYYASSTTGIESEIILYIYYLDYSVTAKVASHPITSYQDTQKLYLAWSPDSNKIAYVCNRDLYIVNSDGTGQELLYKHKSAQYWPTGVQADQVRRIAWSSDGNSIIFDDFNRPSSMTGSPSSLNYRTMSAIDPTTGEKKELLKPGALTSAQSNGSQLLVATVEDDYKALIMNDDGTDIRQFPGDACFTKNWRDAVWSPDGSKIVGFCSSGGLEVVDTQGHIIASEAIEGSYICLSKFAWASDSLHAAYLLKEYNKSYYSLCVSAYDFSDITYLGVTYEYDEWRVDPVHWISWIE